MSTQNSDNLKKKDVESYRYFMIISGLLYRWNFK